MTGPNPNMRNPDRTFTAWDVFMGLFYACCAGALMWLLGMAAGLGW